MFGAIIVSVIAASIPVIYIVIVNRLLRQDEHYE